MQGKQEIFIFDSSTMTNWKVTHVAGEHWFLVERDYLSVDGAVQSLGELVRTSLFGFYIGDYIVPAVISRASIDLRDGVHLSLSFEEFTYTKVEAERK